ncbi:MAG TPA: efflux RND transporter permease subunit, partial [Clostridia bacterium]|nr:efflux RND transporter permease subunit [Clostridia bacterium]
MSFLTRFSLKNVSAVLILCILVIFGGTYSTTKLKKETMPNISIPIVAVYTVYPGASPSDIQEKVTKPLENLVSSVNGIKTIDSTSSENISKIVAEFDYSANMTEMQRKIDDAIKSYSVPANAMAPKTYRINMGDMPVVSLSISNDKLAPEELEQKVRESIIPAISGIEGVAQVQLASDSQKAVYIKLIPAKLKQYGLKLEDLTMLIPGSNVSIPAGSVNMNDTIEPIRVTGQINSIDELKNLQLPAMSGGQTEMSAEMKAKLAKLTPEMLAAMKPKPITLGDVAEITLSTDKITTYSRTNGNPSVIIQVTKTQDANTIDVSDAVKKKLEAIKSNLPGGARTEVKPILDQADYVKESINGMLREGIIGAIFAFIVILLFLRNFRTTIIACISIPLSVLFTLLFMKMLDITFYSMTLNILTLGGLSVAIGRIVDDSIVVIENIYRRLQTESIRNTELIKIAAKEVTTAITSSTLTTISVFLPVIFVTGLAGVMFKPFALTVAIALASSLLVAVTVIPLLSKLLLLKGKSVKHSEFHEGKIMKFYERILAWALNHKAIALITAFVLLIGSFSLVPFIGTSFIAEEKENYVNITINYPEGTDVKVINTKASEIEKVLSKDSDIESYQTTVGTSTSNAMATMMGSGDSGSIMVELKKGSNLDNAIKKYKNKFA